MSDKTTAVWRRFADMWGAEPLARKYGERPPETWEHAINRLPQYDLERGMRRVLRFTKGIPSLPEFLRLCREPANDDFPNENRAPPSHQLEHKPAERWEVQANLHLLGEVTRRAGTPQRITEDNLQPYLVAKRCWADEMRRLEMQGQKPTDGGKALWGEFIESADAA